MSSLFAFRTRSSVMARRRPATDMAAGGEQAVGPGSSGPESVRELRPHFPGHRRAGTDPGSPDLFGARRTPRGEDNTRSIPDRRSGPRTHRDNE
jgi:hypothetical protein